MKTEKYLSIATFVMIVTVAIWAAFRPDLVPVFNLVLLAGLIAVTTIYAYSTMQIAKASKEQAEEMRAQLLVMNKPNVILELIRVTPEKHLIGRIVNDSGHGPAINTDIYRPSPF